MSEAKKIPEGYLQNRLGHLVPVDQIDDVTQQRNELILNIFEQVEEANKLLEYLKQSCNEDSEAHLVIANDDKVTEAEAAESSVTLESFDGSLVWKIVQEPELIATEHVVELQKLLRHAVDELPDGARKPVTAIIKTVVNLETGKPIDLRLLKKMRRIKVLNSQSWIKAMSMLDSCTEQVGLRRYHRFYVRSEDGDLQMVKLNFSAV